MTFGLVCSAKMNELDKKKHKSFIAKKLNPPPPCGIIDTLYPFKMIKSEIIAKIF